MARTNVFTNKNYEEVVAKACFQADDCVRTFQYDGDYSGFLRVMANMTWEIAALKGVAISLNEATAFVKPKVEGLVRYGLLQVENTDSAKGQDELLESVDGWVEYLAAEACIALEKRAV